MQTISRTLNILLVSVFVIAGCSVFHVPVIYVKVANDRGTGIDGVTVEVKSKKTGQVLDIGDNITKNGGNLDIKGLALNENYSFTFTKETVARQTKDFIPQRRNEIFPITLDEIFAITGKVVDKDEDKPISGALVSLLQPSTLKPDEWEELGDLSEKTKPDGSFRISGIKLKEENYRLKIEDFSYGTIYYPQKPFQLSVGKVYSANTIELTRDGDRIDIQPPVPLAREITNRSMGSPSRQDLLRITGIVIDKYNKKPISGANIDLCQKNKDEQAVVKFRENTNSDGSFTISGIPKEEYYTLRINKDSYQLRYFPDKGFHQLKMGEPWPTEAIELTPEANQK